MTEADAIAKLRAYWLLHAPALAVAVVYDDDDTPGDVAFLRVRIALAGNTGITVGGRRESLAGAVTVQCFWPKDAGPGPLERLASAVAAIWRPFRDPWIKRMAPSVSTLLPEGAFNRALVTVGWHADIRPAL